MQPGTRAPSTLEPLHSFRKMKRPRTVSSLTVTEIRGLTLTSIDPLLSSYGRRVLVFPEASPLTEASA